MTAARKEAQALHEGSKWNKRILVVDDEIEIGKIYAEILKPQTESQIASSRSQKVVNLPVKTGRFDFSVTVVTNPEDALAEVKKATADGQGFAMGFFDIRLGAGIDGIELVRQIHEMDPQMYAVFVTAYSDRTVEAITTQLGESRVDRWDYVNKPFTASEILQKARNFVALWNLTREREEQEVMLSDMNRRVLESERVTSVAAVARGVAHEFGNLLMQIMGKADISRNKNPEEMKAALEKIIEASQRAHEILDRFNHLSDTKFKTTYKTDCYVDDIVSGALDLMNHQFKRTGTQVNYEQRDHVRAKVHETSVLQVLVNLFINSLHAMGDRGRIDAAVTDAGERVEVRVRDRGPGVPNDLLEKILEPFFTTKGDKGTGLGLAICREIVEIDHHGEFIVGNHPEGGFEVKISLPKNGGGS